MIKGSSSLIIAAFVTVFWSCGQDDHRTDTDTVNPDFNIASPEYPALVAQAMEHLQDFDFDALGELMSEDVEYYFPDGDITTRTRLIGKSSVLGWWTEWQKNSGIRSMTMTLPNFFPVEAVQNLNMSGLPGVYVITYFSNEMVFAEDTASVRMNFSIHFNSEKKIDRVWAYYDRVPIIEAMKGEDYLRKSPMQ